MEDLLDDFVAETRETLEAIGGEIVAWEAEPSDRARLDSIFRFVHTVKGSCGFLDLPRLERLSHAAEDALAAVRADLRVPDARLVSAVLAIIDRLAELVDAIETGAQISDADDDQLIAALAEVREVEEVVAVQASEAKAPQRAAIRSIRVPLELLDRMMSGVSDMVLSRNELFRRLREVEGGTSVDTAFERLSACVAEMRDAITRTRMQRIEHLFTALPRMVRDLAAELGKTVTLDIDGGDVELDREMIEMIRDPLTHIVRNSVDHGLETPEERQAAGKSRHGTLHVSARQSGNQILIEIADDGRGIDGDRLVAKALAAGLLTAEKAATLSQSAKCALVFEPGLSTAKAVSAISGRGVGMDVVRANVERIGGVVDLDSRPGQGLRVVLRVPLTLTIIPALTLEAGGHRFALPRSAIEEIVRADGELVRLEAIGGGTVANSRGRRLPVVSLAQILGEETGDVAGRTLVILKAAGCCMFALAVDAVHDHEELVVKPAAPAVMATGIYAGTTLPDNGQPMLLLDPGGLARAGAIGEQSDIAEETHAEAEEEEDLVQMLLYRDIDGVRRAVRLSLVERIEDVPAASVSMAAGRLCLAHEERVIPVIACGALPDRSSLHVLRLSDGQAEAAYVIDSVIDIAALPGAIQPAAKPGLVAGVTLADGEPVEVIDPFWIFAGAAKGASRTGPVCLLRGDQAWMREILQPLLRQSGYTVTFDAATAAPDLVIEGEGESDASSDSDERVIRLRTCPEGDASSVYRYDRAGLLSAIDDRLRVARG
ncbi:chemotaxis protein CheA [Sphingomonas sp. ID0503]|uniref:chemotaxis protein CheA n=1 Tax=Sphingomonas sp. ID0503 TaxID=3399691 RepID=UPI003AFA8089